MEAIRAAVVTEPGGPFETTELLLDEPGAGEVKARVLAVGVCRTDLSIRDGTIPHQFPVVAGHEAVGEVEHVGPGVDTVKPGQRVMLSWIPQCGECAQCTIGRPQLCLRAKSTLMGYAADGTTRRRLPDGTPVLALTALGAFAEKVVVPERSAIPIPDEVPVSQAATIGCAVLTGVGASINTAGVRTGESVAVIGVGAVGLNVIQGARIARASRIVAIDRVVERLKLAEQMGATETYSGSGDSVRSAVKGVDHAFDVVGRPETARLGFDLLGPAGQLIVVGVAAPGVEAAIPLLPLVGRERVIRGSWLGSSDVRRDVPRLVEMYRDGDLDLESLVTHEGSLDDLEEAAERLERGVGVRTIIHP